METAVFTIERIWKTFNKGKVIANRDISFSINKGEIIGLLGPNGAGKTTLVKQMVGLLKPDRGRIKFYDQEVSLRPEVGTYFIGYMPQMIGALGDLYVSEALEVTGKLKGLTVKTARREAKDLMEEFNLVELRNRPLKKLSGGENKLVAFCTAIMGNPEALILDEPTDELDPQNRKQVWDKILKLNREQGLTVILVTHNVVEAEKVLQRVGLINMGVVKAIGTVRELKSKVAKQVKLEIKLKEELTTEFITVNPKYTFIPMGEKQWSVYVDEDGLQDAVDLVINSIGLQNLNDFRISTPSLEDVYIQLNTGDRLHEVG